MITNVYRLPKREIQDIVYALQNDEGKYEADDYFHDLPHRFFEYNPDDRARGLHENPDLMAIEMNNTDMGSSSWLSVKNLSRDSAFFRDFDNEIRALEISAERAEEEYFSDSCKTSESKSKTKNTFVERDHLGIAKKLFG